MERKAQELGRGRAQTKPVRKEYGGAGRHITVIWVTPGVFLTLGSLGKSMGPRKKPACLDQLDQLYLEEK